MSEAPRRQPDESGSTRGPVPFLLSQSLRVLAYNLRAHSLYRDHSVLLGVDGMARVLGAAFGVPPEEITRGRTPADAFADADDPTRWVPEPLPVLEAARQALAREADPSKQAVHLESILGEIEKEVDVLAERLSRKPRRFSLHLPSADQERPRIESPAILVDHRSRQAWWVLGSGDLPPLSAFWLDCYAPEASPRLRAIPHTHPGIEQVLAGPDGMGLRTRNGVAAAYYRAAVLVDGVIGVDRAERIEESPWTAYLVGFAPLAIARHADVVSWYRDYGRSREAAVCGTRPKIYKGIAETIHALTCVLDALAPRSLLRPGVEIAPDVWAEHFAILVHHLTHALVQLDLWMLYTPSPLGRARTSGFAPVRVRPEPGGLLEGVFVPRNGDPDRLGLMEWLLGVRDVSPIHASEPQLAWTEEEEVGMTFTLCTARDGTGAPGLYLMPNRFRLEQPTRFLARLARLSDEGILLLLAGRLRIVVSGPRVAVKPSLVVVSDRQRRGKRGEPEPGSSAEPELAWFIRTAELPGLVGDEDQSLYNEIEDELERLEYLLRSGESPAPQSSASPGVAVPGKQVLDARRALASVLDRVMGWWDLNGYRPSLGEEEPSFATSADAAAVLEASEADARAWAHRVVQELGEGTLADLRNALRMGLQSFWTNGAQLRSWELDQQMTGGYFDSPGRIPVAYLLTLVPDQQSRVPLDAR